MRTRRADTYIMGADMNVHSTMEEATCERDGNNHSKHSNGHVYMFTDI